jgi:RNA polymerase sigma-54 factor
VLLRQSLKQNLSQKIDPKIILANTILACSTLELAQAIDRELEENPALERADEDVCGSCNLPPQMCPTCPLKAERPEESETEEFDWQDYYSRDGDWVETVPASDDSEFDPIGNACARKTLHDHLMDQLRASARPDQMEAGEYLVGCINESGYLEGSLEEIAADLGCGVDFLEEVLALIQTFDPVGVGARSLQECLLIQLSNLDEETDASRLARAMVERHWPDVAARRITRLARALRVPVESVEEALRFITRSLTPHPGECFRAPWDDRQESLDAVRPDVIVRRTISGYEVEVVTHESQLLSLNARYREAYQKIRNGAGRSFSEEERRHIVEYVDRAENFIRSIAQRRRTLRTITLYVVQYQQGYVETGQKSFLRPLTRTKVARALKMHESTVSRATANKWVQLPSEEVVSFDLFFDGSMSVKDLIAEIIASEDPANPLSDQEIADILQQRGLEVARRTVVKYREAMNILSSRQRRLAS